jgi:2,3-bisphosphoglycerate-dependent phosphoglycerate mutase
MPYFHAEVVPQLKAGMNVLITAHGNSLRALLMQLENVSEADIAELNIPTGVPRQYDLSIDGDNVSMTSARYLGDQDAIAKAAEAVANQTKG